MTLSDRHREYEQGALRRRDVDPDPIIQFERWMNEALNAELHEPTAMTLATASADGRPSARIVLLKGVDHHGFVFFTNYASQKGRELEANPQATLLFYWDKLERQVRVTGKVARVSRGESELYFATRPRDSQLGALASDQSAVVPGRNTLEDRFAELAEQYDGKPIPTPQHWGGYRLAPHAIEFWQGRLNRLHDRLCYQRQPDGTWKIQRLAP